MTATLTTTPTIATTSDSEQIRRVTARTLAAIGAVDPDDQRWRALAPVVSAAANHLRSALGVSVVGSSAGAPAIVAERDFATAAHALLARDVRIADARAATEFTSLAQQITLALS